MKKVTFILALGVMFTLAACGSESTSNQTTDSTAVQADTTAVLTDSTVSGGGSAAPSELHSDVQAPTSHEEVK
jgi:ABC-type glycerol-3-phosphate transport system substrate-binding protein